jgi:hypothetical protein
VALFDRRRHARLDEDYGRGGGQKPTDNQRRAPYGIEAAQQLSDEPDGSA